MTPEETMFPVPLEILEAVRETESDPTTGEVRTLESVLPNYPQREDLVTYLANLYRRLQAESAAIDARYAPILEIIEGEKDYIKKQLERCKKAFFQALPPVTGAECVANDSCSVFYSPSTAVEIENEDDIPFEFTKVVTTVDKIAVAKALESGHEVSGATLKRNFNVQIKPGGAKAIAAAKKRTQKKLGSQGSPQISENSVEK